jgi:hypothetical protein
MRLANPWILSHAARWHMSVARHLRTIARTCVREAASHDETAREMLAQAEDAARVLARRLHRQRTAEDNLWESIQRALDAKREGP